MNGYRFLRLPVEGVDDKTAVLCFFLSKVRRDNNRLVSEFEYSDVLTYMGDSSEDVFKALESNGYLVRDGVHVYVGEGDQLYCQERDGADDEMRQLFVRIHAKAKAYSSSLFRNGRPEASKSVMEGFRTTSERFLGDNNKSPITASDLGTLYRMCNSVVNMEEPVELTGSDYGTLSSLIKVYGSVRAALIVLRYFDTMEKYGNYPSVKLMYHNREKIHGAKTKRTYSSSGF